LIFTAYCSLIYFLPERREEEDEDRGGGGSRGGTQTPLLGLYCAVADNQA